jgi:hypothetical protein
MLKIKNVNRMTVGIMLKKRRRRSREKFSSVEWDGEKIMLRRNTKEDTKKIFKN